MLMRTLAHPLGIGILVTSGAGAIAVMELASWSDRGPWIIGWGLAAYGTLVLVLLIKERKATRLLAPLANTSQESSGFLGGAGRTNAGERLFAEEASPENIVALTQDALRRLNNPAALGMCGLAPRLPRTLSAVSDSHPDGHADVTPLHQARALRAALIAGIERLKDAGGVGAMDGGHVRYVILYDEYVLGRPNNQIMARHSISESTFHRYRREAIRALASELERGEEILSREQAASEPSP
ncbi:MAG: hypothetical protein ABIP13_06225 [Tepidiformaceae bacterium]